MRLIRIVLSLVLFSPLVWVNPEVSSAACAGPEIRVTGKAAKGPVASGDTVQISGRYWIGGCDDTGPADGGCAWFGQSEADREREDPQPYRDLILTLRGPLGRTSQTSIRLAVVPEMVDGRFTVRVIAPDVPDGTYEITNDRIDFAKVEIVIRSKP
jgi:hypothetical protein